MAVLLERDAELAQLAGLLDSALAGRGGVAVVQGSPGIGKTRVLEELTATARRRDVTVLSAIGGELEQEFPYGVVRQLFDPVLHGEPHAEELLEGAARLALPALSFAPADGAIPSEAAILHGLYWLVAGLAARGPLLIAIDDAQWADASSMRVRRLPRAAPRGSAARARARDAARRPLGAGPAAGRAGRREARARPRAAERGGGLRSDLRRDGHRGSTRIRRCGASSRGREPVPDGRAHPGCSGRRARTHSAEAVARLGLLATAGVDRSVRRRLARLAPGAVALARAVAVLGDDAQLRHAAALAELDERTAAGAASTLAAADILERGASLRFAHALVRASVTSDAGDARARRAPRARGAAARCRRRPRRARRRTPPRERAARRPLGGRGPAPRGARRNRQGAPQPAVTIAAARAGGTARARSCVARCCSSSGWQSRTPTVSPASVTSPRRMPRSPTPRPAPAAALARAQGLVILMRPAEAVDVLLPELDAAERDDRELALRIAAQLAIRDARGHGSPRAARARIERLAQERDRRERGRAPAARRAGRRRTRHKRAPPPRRPSSRPGSSGSTGA